MSPHAFLVKIKLVSGLGLGVILMASAGVASYVTVSQLIEATVSEDQIEDRLVLLERTTSGIKTAEAALRQYLLSGDAGDLQKIGQTRAAMDDAIARMRSAGALTEQPALDDLIARRWTLVTQLLAARQSAGLPGAVAILTSDFSRQLRQRTDDLLGAARQRETITLDRTHTAGLYRAEWAQRIIMLNGLLFLAMLAWAFYVVRRHEAGRKRVEAQLRDSEVMSRSITEGMAEGVITTSMDDIILDANGAALELLGYEKSDLKGRDISELIPQRLRREYKEFTAALRARPEAFRRAGREVLGRRRDGSEFLVNVSYGDVQVAGQRLFTATFHDITETKRVTEALRASETQLRQITDTVPALIAYIDKAQRFSFHNKAYE
ncbi:PAS domain S-box protein, partial [Polaromonas sp.]|uniref:PAS domain S-box protein n=1 Tax=Polaromonas sp. TaxID=1869339 RepID=UPI0018058FF7